MEADAPDHLVAMPSAAIILIIQNKYVLLSSIRNMMTSSNGNIFRVTGPYWGIHRSPVNFPHKDQWRGALVFSLICARIHGWTNNREAGDLRRHHALYDVIVKTISTACTISLSRCDVQSKYPDSKVYGANMGPTWVLSAPDGPHVGPMNLAIRVYFDVSSNQLSVCRINHLSTETYGGNFKNVILQVILMIGPHWCLLQWLWTILHVALNRFFYSISRNLILIFRVTGTETALVTVD